MSTAASMLRPDTDLRPYRRASHFTPVDDVFRQRRTKPLLEDFVHAGEDHSSPCCPSMHERAQDALGLAMSLCHGGEARPEATLQNLHSLCRLPPNIAVSCVTHFFSKPRLYQSLDEKIAVRRLTTPTCKSRPKPDAQVVKRSSPSGRIPTHRHHSRHRSEIISLRGDCGSCRVYGRGSVL